MIGERGWKEGRDWWMWLTSYSVTGFLDAGLIFEGFRLLEGIYRSNDDVTRTCPGCTLVTDPESDAIRFRYLHGFRCKRKYLYYVGYLSHSILCIRRYTSQ